MTSKQQGWQELIASVILAAITVFYLTKALQLPLSHESSTDLGPGVYPTWIGVVLAVLTAVFALQSVWKILKGSDSQHHAAEPGNGAPSGRRIPDSVLKVVAAVLLTALYVWGFEPLGFVIATAVYLWLLSLLFVDGWRPARKRVVLSLVFGIVSSIVLNAVFVYVLSVLLPIGLLGF